MSDQTDQTLRERVLLMEQRLHEPQSELWPSMAEDRLEAYRAGYLDAVNGCADMLREMLGEEEGC